MTTETTTTKRPSHRVYHEVKGKDGKTVRTHELGAIWPHRDGKGYNLKLDYLPVGGGWLTIRAIEDEQQEGAA